MLSSHPGKEKMLFGNTPCFFRIFFSDSMAEWLNIPEQFVDDHLKNVTACKAILKVPSGGRWPVELRKARRGLFLVEGWERFLGDNLIQELDFLLFTYDGDMCFNVDIFDQSGVPRPLIDAAHGSCGGLKGGCQPEDANLKGSGRGNKNQQRPKVHQGKTTNLQKKLGPSEWQPGKGKSAVAAVKEEAVEEETNSFASQFPSFKMEIRDYNVRRSSYVVNIPRNIAKHFRKDKNEVFLKSLEGKAFVVSCRNYNGKYFFGKGWRRFVDDNQLKVGDVCIFELVGEMELQFHISNK